MECSPLAISLGLLLITTTVLSEINIDLNYDKNTLTKKYDVKGSINLYCTVKRTEKESYSVKWERDSKEIKDVSDRISITKDNDVHKLRISKAAETDAGMYSCVAFMGSEEVARKNITLFSNYRVKTPDHMNFVEGEIIRIACQVHGRPAPAISWEIGNETYSESRDRVTLERDEDKGIDNAILVIKEAEMGDRGTYKCIGVSADRDVMVSDETMVRIKDKYAALWPFLGICAEVFILCAIILIYEKKRNKAELEESDTDQSPDQKNTPDHGKDSNLRHRQ